MIKDWKRFGVALKEDIEDRDEIFSKGNTIRNILEYTLKHFCVIRGIEIDIEQKYGHIELGELRKKIKDIPNINIPQSLINTANELSHDSGKKYNIENVREFYGDVCELVKQIKDAIGRKKMICDWGAFMENLFTHFDLTEFPQIE